MYLDPGFGSMLIQFLVAGVATAGAVLFMLKGKLQALFHKKGAQGDEEADETETSQDEQPAAQAEKKDAE